MDGKNNTKSKSLEWIKFSVQVGILIMGIFGGYFAKPTLVLPRVLLPYLLDLSLEHHLANYLLSYYLYLTAHETCYNHDALIFCQADHLRLYPQSQLLYVI